MANSTTPRPRASTPSANTVAIYARVSSGRQEREQTIETQLRELRLYCERQGWQVVEVYLDQDVSGTVLFHERPAGARLLADAAVARFAAVAVYDASRLGRDRRSVIVPMVLDELERLGVGVHSPHQRFADSPEGLLETGFHSLFASYERTQIVRRFQAGKERAAAEGRWLGGGIPYGYRVEGKHFIPDESDLGNGWTPASVARWLYREQVETGASCYELAARLGARGLHRPGGHPWQWWHVWRVLSSECYAGSYPCRRGQGPARQIPALVTADEWTRAQEILRTNRMCGHERLHDWLLRGLLVCGVCGHQMSGMLGGTPGRSRLGYYRCLWRYRPEGRGQCNMRYWQVREVDAEVWSVVAWAILHPNEAARQAVEEEQAAGEDTGPIRTELGTLERILAEKQGERDAVVRLYRRGAIEEGMVEAQLAEIAAEEETLRRRIAALDLRVEAAAQRALRVQDASQLLAAWQRVLATDPLPQALQRQAVETLVSRVVLHADGTAEVSWRFATTPARVAV